MEKYKVLMEINRVCSASQSILKIVQFKVGRGKIGARELRRFKEKACT